jgi:hypothetical protein
LSLEALEGVEHVVVGASRGTLEVIPDERLFTTALETAVGIGLVVLDGGALPWVKVS